MPEVSDLDRRHMDELTAELRTKSDKIRCLRAAGYERGDIARYLGIRYQFVYNVDTAPQAKGKPLPLRSPREAAGSEAADRSAAALEPAPNWVWAVIRKGGTIQLPAEFLEAMGAVEGDQVQLALDGDVVRVLSRAAAFRETRELVRRYVPEGVSLVDELLAERRAETAKEERG